MTLPGMMESIRPIDFPSRTPCLGYVSVPPVAAAIVYRMLVVASPIGPIFSECKLNMDIGKKYGICPYGNINCAWPSVHFSDDLSLSFFAATFPDGFHPRSLRHDLAGAAFSRLPGLQSEALAKLAGNGVFA